MHDGLGLRKKTDYKPKQADENDGYERVGSCHILQSNNQGSGVGGGKTGNDKESSNRE